MASVAFVFVAPKSGIYRFEVTSTSNNTGWLIRHELDNNISKPMKSDCEGMHSSRQMSVELTEGEKYWLQVVTTDDEYTNQDIYDIETVAATILLRSILPEEDLEPGDGTGDNGGNGTGDNGGNGTGDNGGNGSGDNGDGDDSGTGDNSGGDKEDVYETSTKLSAIQTLTDPETQKKTVLIQVYDEQKDETVTYKAVDPSYLGVSTYEFNPLSADGIGETLSMMQWAVDVNEDGSVKKDYPVIIDDQTYFTVTLLKYKSGGVIYNTPVELYDPNDTLRIKLEDTFAEGEYYISVVNTKELPVIMQFWGPNVSEESGFANGECYDVPDAVYNSDKEYLTLPDSKSDRTIHIYFGNDLFRKKSKAIYGFLKEEDGVRYFVITDHQNSEIYIRLALIEEDDESANTDSGSEGQDSEEQDSEGQNSEGQN